MAETIEYVLVFAVTMSIAGFSIAALGGAISAVRTTDAAASFSRLVGGVDEALTRGTSSSTMTLSDAALSCQHGTISFSSGGQSYTSFVGVRCSFAFEHLSCVCELAFSSGPDGLGLRVVK